MSIVLVSQTRCRFVRCRKSVSVGRRVPRTKESLGHGAVSLCSCELAPMKTTSDEEREAEVW